MFRLLPPGLLELLLFAVLLAGLLFVVKAVRRRHGFVPAPEAGETEPIPYLETQQRITGTLRRLYYDRLQEATLAEMEIGKRRITFAATDYPDARERYASLVGQKVDAAVYGLATLAPGGAEAMRELIKDFDHVDNTAHLVRLIQSGQYPNDYAAIARVLSHREDVLSDETPVTVYRGEVVQSGDLMLVLELATPQEARPAPFGDQEMVHGSARLFGYLAGAQ